jgi:acetyl esterase/lipase
VTDDAQAELNVDLTKGFLMGGTSAGANFTGGITHFLRDEGVVPKVTGVVILAGSFCHPDARTEEMKERILSVDEVTDAPGLTRKSIDYFGSKYRAPPEDKRLSPLLFASHAGVAEKAYFSICGWDPRRDEAIYLSQRLSEEGVESRADIFAGLPHGFWATYPTLHVSKDWETKLIANLRWLLE